jgi:hypothetical protein
MVRRAFLGVVALVASAALIGCGPPWAVVVQSAPNPFFGQRLFAVQPVDFSGLMVGSKPEPVYLAEKDAGQRASFAEDKAAFNERFLADLIAQAGAAAVRVVPATGPADAPFTIRPVVHFIEPGFYAYLVSQASRVEMSVRIVAPDGRILDEINLAHSTPSTASTAASGTRLRSDGAALGAIVARYLRVRVGLGE